MPAHSETFPWPSYYGHFDFFESRMQSHSRVHSLTQISPGYYCLKRSDGDEIYVFICECYSFGVAEYAEVKKEFGRVDAIVINSNWCGYTGDAKDQCRDEKTGLFSLIEFMAALNINDYWEYTPKD